MTNNTKPVLWTRDFMLAFVSNLMMFFSFYLLMPVLPFYVMGKLGASESVAGGVLSLYILSALIIRPFSGYMVDTFARKPLYLICYSIFTAIFAGYLIATTMTIFILLRVVHGLSFGVTTVSGSTVAIDIMPAQRRGEGIGYFGMASNIAMAVGPMTGLFLYNSYDFDVIFMASFLSSLVGLCLIVLIKVPDKIISEVKEVISFDRFVLIKGLPQAVVLAVLALGYGVMSNYIGVYSRKMDFGGAAGFFFTLQAIGIVASRLLSANAINKGTLKRLIYMGMGCLVLGYSLFLISDSIVVFYISALLLGLGYGYISPASQTMFINLARHERRGTANSTYFTAWDLGIGIGILMGGKLIASFGFTMLFVFCLSAVLIGGLFFRLVASPYFSKYKLR